MPETVIKVENLSKQYRIGAREGYKTFRETLIDSAKAPFLLCKEIAKKLVRPVPSGVGPDHVSQENTIWALKDVSFQVKQGEVLGIIGKNGAGKSTLLKVLSKITEPTQGRVELRGRVGSLLEVGTGFHPELTGHENVYLYGAILGMDRREVTRKFDEIIAFAELERFVDTPVKRYSSGMYMRLAFAVAAHLEPEILLVDEVLAVGDAAFQKKCLGKMGDVSEQGRTVLFVSHNLNAISTLTKRTILMDIGHLAYDGDTYSSLGRYRSIYHATSDTEYIDPNKSKGVTRARVITSDPNQMHRFGRLLKFEFDFVFDEEPTSGAFSFQIIDEQARPVVHLWLLDSEQKWSRAGRVLLRCVLTNPRIYMGRYSLITHLGDRASQEKYETLEGICPFEVIMDQIPREYEWVPGSCTYLEDAKWEVI